MIKRSAILIVTLVLSVLSTLHGKPAFRLPAYLDYQDKSSLLQQLGKAKTDTEKMGLLSALAIGLANNDPAEIDTTYIYRLLTLNASAKIINDAPFRNLLLALRAGRKNDYAGELVLLEQVVEQMDGQNINTGSLLFVMRWVFNVADKQEDKFQYYSKKLIYYLQVGQNYSAAVCEHCIAGYFVYKGDYNSSISHYIKAGDLFLPYIKFSYINELLVVGTSYDEWGNSEKALFYLKKGLGLARSYHYTEEMYFALIWLAHLEYDTKRYKQSLSYLDSLLQSERILPAENADIHEVNVLRSLDYTALNNPVEAYKALKAAEGEQTASNIMQASHAGEYGLDFGFYKYYRAINELPTAEKYLLKAYQKSASLSNTGLKLTYLKELVRFYGSQDSIPQAWKYTLLYNRAFDSLQNKTNAYKIASYENERTENAQNKKMIGLQQQRAVQEAVIKQRTIIIWVSLLGLLLVCGSLVFIYRQLRVNKRTLINLRKTQRQLIQSEKMASLGELTAGIAHEIQNPLNFVNNFSEVSIDMLVEMKLELKAGKAEDALDIAGDIEQNLQKIIHHGKRADGIVKGMLQHSRASSNTKEPTDINELADEYLRLAYHGLRAKDKSFNSNLVTHFDENLPMINVVPQDIGRVLLNLFTNAFYSVHAKQKTAGKEYKPVVELSTTAPRIQQDGTKIILIKVKDNGGGIPEHIRHKIMQPFFTTKPTGEGTGLGLSMSYDIVVKEHGGNIDVTSKENEYAEFTITLPL
jgi:two-component system NtrC family sensor kinase